MAVYKETIHLQAHGGTPSFFNITDQVKEAIAKSGIKDGICAVISPHTTCAVYFQEFVHDILPDGDESLQEDLNNVLQKIVPDQVSEDQYNYPGEAHFAAVKKWDNLEEYLPTGQHSDLFNGDAHLKATIIGSSQVLDVDDGELGVGKTGYVYFVDFDRTRGRARKCKITVIGE